MSKSALAGLTICSVLAALPAETGKEPGSEKAVVQTGYHLTARPWKPLDIPREKYLEAIEGVCRFSIQHQNASGAIIDPFLKREHQYATPYFAYAAGTLIAAGRASDLLPYGVKAMEHSTANFAAGRDAIPDKHGEFFIAALTGALELYAGHVPEKTMALWRQRMKTLRDVIVGTAVNNWETYVMKGEWMRVLAGLADKDDVTAAIETIWTSHQRSRIAPARCFSITTGRASQTLSTWKLWAAGICSL
jgi:hypothetical protein